MVNRIKELRAKFNLTQNDLALKVNVRRETIVFLEKGKYNPSLKLAYDIAKVFDLTIEEVFIFDEE
ncbi:MAG: transcriptional regulator [Bacteroidetes bacterium]|nr:MAG: transcriptional regulator [Bacteroidota bacterium]